MSSIVWTIEAFGNDVCLVMDMLTLQEIQGSKGEK
jgi:hypothetical protein